MATTYENVALIIGEEMDKTWKRIMERVATASVDTSTFTSEDGKKLSSLDFQDFLANLGGANLSIKFSSLTPKGEVTRYSGYELTPAHEITTMGVSGSNSIGVNISF